MKQGIDVSKWQPKVDWKKVKADGTPFAIIRIGYCYNNGALKLDSAFTRHIKGALAAGLGAASGLTFAYWAALFLTLIGGICQLIAGIKGVKHSKRSEKAGGLIVWGAIVAVFSVLSIVMNLVNGGEFNVTSVLTGVAVPALYIYGAVLNSKADAQYAA